MSTPVIRALDLKKLSIAHGAHEGPEEGMCVMEAVAFVAGEKHSDHPACASKAIGAFMRSWNDSLPSDEAREILKPYIVKLVGTAASAEVEAKRAWLARDWYVREFTPTWLELAGLSEHAQALRTLNQLVDDGGLAKANAALSAAWSAARSAAESAARSAAWSAAESAAEQALAPTVTRLQASALKLIDAMIAVRE